ncbi:MAG: 3-dehydroquinate synthase, partial [Gammaproteobacteria bacterium]
MLIVFHLPYTTSMNFIEHSIPHNHRIVIITDPTISQLHLHSLKTMLGNQPYPIILIAEGEHAKTLETWQRVLDELFTLGCTRETLLVAFGGGVVSDIVGFVAATYQRGIPWIAIPTTLLAQVDAAIGGKTGVNHPYGKNMIGAFHPPICIITEPLFLDSLPQRQYCAGLAEIIKYGLIYDADFFMWLEKNMVFCVQRVPAVLSQAIQRSGEIKMALVKGDEKDISNQRAILNFGHTFGHAMENVAGYGTLLHGEAVAIGMVMATALSVHLYELSETILKRVKNLLRHAQLPIVRPASLSKATIIDAMKRDKK